MAARVWKSAYPFVFGHSHQHLQNTFFDPSTPSMRKVDGRGNKKKIMLSIVAKNVVASQPPERQPTGTQTACAKNVSCF